MTREEFLGALPARSTDERIELARALDALLAATERNALERAAHTVKGMVRRDDRGDLVTLFAAAEEIRALIPGKD